MQLLGLASGSCLGGVSTYTVLIVEDELLVRMGIAGSVSWERMDMRVVAEEADGAAGWEAFKKYHPDIVIADIRMPRMDGLELLRRIRGADGDCAVILVTNVENSPTLEEAKSLGIVDVLIKASMKRDDIARTVLKARDALPGNRGKAERPIDDGEIWRSILSGGDERAPFEPKGFVVLRILTSERLSHRLTGSLISLFEHRVSANGDFCVIAHENGAIALMRSECEQDKLNAALVELGRYVKDNFGESLIFVTRFCDLAGAQARSAIQSALDYVYKETLFDRSVLKLDENGVPISLGHSSAAKKSMRREIMVAIDYIDEHISDELSIQRVSEIAGYHPAYFSNLFKRELGVSYSEFLTNLRITRAKELMLKTDLTIQQIALNCGFPDFSYFSTRFKRMVGMTPSQWRTKNE